MSKINKKQLILKNYNLNLQKKIYHGKNLLQDNYFQKNKYVHIKDFNFLKLIYNLCKN